MGHGGKREGAGRPKGRQNRATAKLKGTFSDLAKAMAPEALEVLAAVMRDEEATGPARVAAANSIIDRAYGKPPAAQSDEGDGEAQALTFNINVNPPVGDVRVTKPQ